MIIAGKECTISVIGSVRLLPLKPLLAGLIAVTMPLSASGQAPELLLLHGHIFTADRSRPWAEAIAITGNRIAAVGSNDEIAALAGVGTKRIDLRGGLVIPGINDADVELRPPFDLFRLSVSPSSSVGDVAIALISAADESPASMWLIGEVGQKVLRDPIVTAEAMEKTAPGRRVILRSSSSRAMVLSAAALNALRIDANAADPAGGAFGRDANGHLDGKAFGYAVSNVERIFAAQLTDEALVSSLQDFASAALRAGITSVQATDHGPFTRYEKIVRHANISVRIRLIRSPQTDSKGRDIGEGSDIPRLHSERRLSVAGGTRWIIDEMQPGGELDFSAAEIARIFAEAAASSDPLILSIKGPRTVGSLLDSMRAVNNVDWKSKRVRFDEADVLPPDLIPAIKSAGVVIVEDPSRLPAGTMKGLLGAGVPLALSASDEASLFRNIMIGSEKLSRQEVIEAFTRGGAFAEFSENEKGTIAAGKLADIAVLSQDIFKVELPDIPDTHSILTIVDGAIVYDAGVLEVPGRKPPREIPLD